MGAGGSGKDKKKNQRAGSAKAVGSGDGKGGVTSNPAWQAAADCGPDGACRAGGAFGATCGSGFFPIATEFVKLVACPMPAPLAPIPAFPQRGKEQNRQLWFALKKLWERAGNQPFSNASAPLRQYPSAA